jgi:hypothetical protein
MKIVILITYLVALYFSIFSSTSAAEPQISLTASDGTGIEFRNLQARIVLDGFLAFTELQMVFYNPEDRQREGRFQIVLPENATISRFAMKIGNYLQEGEVVEREFAARVYEDFLHRRQDPALLEMDRGNRFNARIFPIPPLSEKVLILSYSQRLTTDYVLPLKGLPLLKQLSLTIFYDSKTFNGQTVQPEELRGTSPKPNVLTVIQENYQPTADLQMSVLSPTQNLVMQSENWLAAKIIPFPDSASTMTTPVSENLLILLDTSASQAPFLADSLKRLETLLPQMPIGTLRVYHFDQNLTEAGKSEVAATHLSLLAKSKESPALGASRLDNIPTGLHSLSLPPTRILLISDVVITAGESSATALAKQFKAIPWLTRLDVVIPSFHSDKSTAQVLVKAGQQAGIVTSWQRSDVQLLHQLFTPVYSDIPITVSGVTWYWPEKISTLQTNEPIILFAQRQGSAQFSIRVGEREILFLTQSAEPLLLKREVAQARISKLLQLIDQIPTAPPKVVF